MRAPDLEENRLPFDVAELPQPLPERSDLACDRPLSGRREKPDLRGPGCLLGRARGAGRRNGEQKYEAEERSRAHEMPWSPLIAESVDRMKPAGLPA